MTSAGARTSFAYSIGRHPSEDRIEASQPASRRAFTTSALSPIAALNSGVQPRSPLALTSAPAAIRRFTGFPPTAANSMKRRVVQTIPLIQTGYRIARQNRKPWDWSRYRILSILPLVRSKEANEITLCVFALVNAQVSRRNGPDIVTQTANSEVVSNRAAVYSVG